MIVDPCKVVAILTLADDSYELELSNHANGNGYVVALAQLEAAARLGIRVVDTLEPVDKST